MARGAETSVGHEASNDEDQDLLLFPETPPAAEQSQDNTCQCQ